MGMGRDDWMGYVGMKWDLKVIAVRIFGPA